MRMQFKRGRKKACGRLSKSPLVERLKAGAAVLAISLAGCSFSTGGIPATDGAGDMAVDSEIVDLSKRPDSRSDGKSIPDKGSDKSKTDNGIDSKASDKGIDGPALDLGNDFGADLSQDSGSVCPGVVNDTAYGKATYVGTPVTVGGYSIENTGAVPGGINVDVACGSNSSPIQNSVFLAKGGSDVIVQATADGKKIRLRNISNSSTVANLNIVVETL